MSETLCSGADGTCELPARKGGLCWGHWKRKLRRQPLSTSIREQARPERRKGKTPLEALMRRALELRDELDTATDEDFRRRQGRFRFMLRQYLWRYVPTLLRQHRAQLEQLGGVEAFLKTYRSKSTGQPRRPHHPHLKKQHLQSHPQHAARKAKS